MITLLPLNYSEDCAEFSLYLGSGKGQIKVYRYAGDGFLEFHCRLIAAKNRPKRSDIVNLLFDD